MDDTTTTQTGTVYIREAVLSDLDAIARLLTQAFIHDPLINWFGSRQDFITAPSPENMQILPLGKLPKDIELIFHLRYALLLSVHFSGGRVTVLVRRESQNFEQILSVATWQPPREWSSVPTTAIKVKQYRSVIFGTWRQPGGWGLSGLKKIFLRALPAMDKLRQGASEVMRLNVSEVWTLSNVATDPKESGKGYCRMVLNYGFERIVGNKPIYLHTCTAKARDMYRKFGFQMARSLTLGEGEVTDLGLMPKKGDKNNLHGITLDALIKLPV